MDTLYTRAILLLAKTTNWPPATAAAEASIFLLSPHSSSDCLTGKNNFSLSILKPFSSIKSD